MAPFTPCLTCAKEFKTIRDLKQHQLDAYHFEEPYEEHWSKSEMLFAYFTGYYAEYVLIQRDEQRKARKVVRKELEKLKESFPKSGRTNEYHTFEIINIEPAGSTATQTKVYQADEYDFNLIVENENIKVDDLTSIFIEVTGNDEDEGYLWQHQRPQNRKRGVTPPPGYTTVYYDDFNGKYLVNTKKYVVARKNQEALYSLIKDALLDVNSQSNVTVSPFPHGPAVTVNIPPTQPDEHHKCKDSVTHAISVDFSLAIKCKDIAVSKYGWPRLRTKQCLPRYIINRTLGAGVYLVPKHEFFWYISFSNAAKVLLRSIDSAKTCRRRCHKILKADFLKWRSKESFQGISTFIFKNHLFWFNENLNKPDLEEYWHLSNVGQCYIDLLRDLALRLARRILPNYFNTKDNLLSKKNEDVLDRLSNRIHERIFQLEQIHVPPVVDEFILR